MADPNDEALKQAQVAGDKVARRQAVYYKRPDLLAADLVVDEPFFQAPYDAKLETFGYIPALTVLAADAANVTFTVKKWTAGVPTVLVTFIPTADLTVVAFNSFGLSPVDLAAGDVVTLDIRKAGPGALLPAGVCYGTYALKLVRGTLDSCLDISRTPQTRVTSLLEFTSIRKSAFLPISLTTRTFVISSTPCSIRSLRARVLPMLQLRCSTAR